MSIYGVFFWSVFSSIWTEYGDLRKPPYSVQIRENTDQKKIRIWTILHTEKHLKTFSLSSVCKAERVVREILYD